MVINNDYCAHIYGNISSMKTTVEISGELLQQAKEYAARKGVPMRAVFELGLQLALKDKKRPSRPFKLKTITTKGEGLVCEDDWSVMRSFIYEGHGG